MELETGENTDTQQFFSDRQTALILAGTMLPIGYGLLQWTGWSLFVWWQAGATLIGSYLLAALLLLGVNQFVKLGHREYKRLSP